MIIPYMQQQKWGRIVNISSYVVKEPTPAYLISSIFRTSLVAFSKCLSQEFGADNILVNTVCPSLFMSSLGERLVTRWAKEFGKTEEEIIAEKQEITAIKRIGEPDELAALVAFLCSEKGGYVTGQSITIDGGRSKGLF